MAQSQFSLLWNAHKRNICHGLSTLQQNGEFVDMTLAADGHMVKVHQVIIALASPYIKELITSAQCSHPVIFLSKISYTTLCSILEYVYTGEVLVSIENLSELLDAGKELHIKGLEDMKLAESMPLPQHDNKRDSNTSNEHLDENLGYFGKTNSKHNEDETNYTMTDMLETDEGPRIVNTFVDDTYDDDQDDEEESITPDVNMGFKKPDSKDAGDSHNLSAIQYTVSNQGSLQMILNRFLYYLKHSNRNSTRQWRCVDYLNNIRCPAHVFTKDDVVVQRISAHVHSFHDKRILKKVKDGSVFSAIHEAEQNRKNKKPNANNSD